jgi:hypothetical protein
MISPATHPISDYQHIIRKKQRIFSTFADFLGMWDHEMPIYELVSRLFATREEELLGEHPQTMRCHSDHTSVVFSTYY